MKGSLSEGVLPGLLRDLYVGRKTGLLHFRRGEERRSVFMRVGHIVHADTNVREERLGETLLRMGALEAGDFKRAVGFMLRDRKRLGQVLQELGLIDKQRLEDALAVQVREILSKVFTWTDGEYDFEEQTPETPVEADITLRVPTGELILQAARSVQDPDVVRYCLGDIDRVLGLSMDPLLRFQNIALTPLDGYVLSRVDGTLSARELMELIPQPPEEVQKSLFGLLTTGVIEYQAGPPKPRPAAATRAKKAAPGAAGRMTTPTAASPAAPATPASAEVPPAPAAPPPPAATTAAAPERPAPDAAARATDERRKQIVEAYEGLRTRTHYELLGIARDATEAQVKEAYFRLARKFHPDVHHDIALGDQRDKLEAVFIRLGEAYEVLRSPRTRASYERELASRAGPAAGAPTPTADPVAEARAAEESIRKADRRLAEEKYWEAIQLLELALPRVEGKVKQHGRVLLARAYSKNPNWVKQGEELLLTVVREDPKNLEAWVTLARIYKAGGLKSRTLSTFRKVLELQADHEEALAEVRELAGEAEAPSEGPGLLRKLFGKR